VAKPGVDLDRVQRNRDDAVPRRPRSRVKVGFTALHDESRERAKA
jgi:hypothetical protein